MKLFLSIITTFTSWFIFSSCKSQECYESSYDMVKEKLCLTNDRFSFELIDPFAENRITSGYFKEKNDTLIFNPAVKQNKIDIKNCQLNESKSEGNEIKFIDFENDELSWITIKIKNEIFTSNEKGVIKINGPIPDSISISIVRLDKKLWPGPINNYYKVGLNYDKNGGNQLVIQIDTSKGFKMPYEHEVKLLKIDSRLYYLDSKNNISSLYFKKQ